jgi:hypothetical protein
LEMLIIGLGKHIHQVYTEKHRKVIFISGFGGMNNTIDIIFTIEKIISKYMYLKVIGGIYEEAIIVYSNLFSVSFKSSFGRW